MGPQKYDMMEGSYKEEMGNDDRLHPEYALAQWMWNPESSIATLCALGSHNPLKTRCCERIHCPLFLMLINQV